MQGCSPSSEIRDRYTDRDVDVVVTRSWNWCLAQLWYRHVSIQRSTGISGGGRHSTTHEAVLEHLMGLTNGSSWPAPSVADPAWLEGVEGQAAVAADGARANLTGHARWRPSGRSCIAHLNLPRRLLAVLTGSEHPRDDERVAGRCCVGGQSSFGVRAGAVMPSCAAGFLMHCAMADTIDGRFDQINRSSA